MTESIKAERSGDSLVITFNRPELRNPLSVSVVQELTMMLTEDSLIGGVGQIVFTGRDGVFASGANLREINQLSPFDAADFARRGQKLMKHIEALPMRTISAVDGFCFGGALDLALACDNRIASAKSMFCHPGAGLGIITGWGGTQRLPRLVGEAFALEMFFTASPVTAQEAMRIGLVDAVVHEPLVAAINSSLHLP